MKAPIHAARFLATKALLARKSQAARLVVETPADFSDAADSVIKLQIEETPAKDRVSDFQ